MVITLDILIHMKKVYKKNQIKNFDLSEDQEIM